MHRDPIKQGGLLANPKAYPVWQPIAASLAALSCLAITCLQLIDPSSTLSVSVVSWIFFGTYLFIDIISGLLHIILDNPYFADDNNWHGVIAPYAKGFQEHHDNTTIICNMPIVEHLRPMALPLLMNVAVGLLWHRHPWFPTYHLAVSVFLCVMQMAHRWAHMQRVARPWSVTTLQHWGVLVSPAQHMKHHKSPYAIQFCIMPVFCFVFDKNAMAYMFILHTVPANVYDRSGMMNPVLNMAARQNDRRNSHLLYFISSCILALGMLIVAYTLYYDCFWQVVVLPPTRTEWFYIFVAATLLPHLYLSIFA